MSSLTWDICSLEYDLPIMRWIIEMKEGTQEKAILLTLSQTTNFRLFQTLPDDNFKFDEKKGFSPKR